MRLEARTAYQRVRSAPRHSVRSGNRQGHSLSQIGQHEIWLWVPRFRTRTREPRPRWHARVRVRTCRTVRHVFPSSNTVKSPAGVAAYHGSPHSLPSGSFRARDSVRSGRPESVVDCRSGLPKSRGREGPLSSSREAAAASWKSTASGVGKGQKTARVGRWGQRSATHRKGLKGGGLRCADPPYQELSEYRSNPHTTPHPRCA